MGKKQTFREEVFNVTLADLLTSYGLEAAPETIFREGRPDVIVNMSGVKVVVEGRFSDMDSLHDTIKERVYSGLADIAIAILYPPELQASKTTNEIRDSFHKLKFNGAICVVEKRIEIKSFEACSLEDIVSLVNNTFHMLVQDSAVNSAVEELDGTLDATVKLASTSGLFFRSETVVTRLKQTLGITDHDENEGNGD